MDGMIKCIKNGLIYFINKQYKQKTNENHRPVFFSKIL